MEFINFLNDNGLLNVAAVVITVFGSAVLNILRKNVHNKNVDGAIALLQRVALGEVARNAQNVGLSNSDRFNKGVQYLKSVCDQRGFSFLDSTLEGILESAYQSYKASGKDIHTQDSVYGSDETQQDAQPQAQAQPVQQPVQSEPVKPNNAE
jgi:hypothetical protein